MAQTMLEAHVDADTRVTIHRVPIPQITHPSQLLIKVAVAGTNPKDWKLPAGMLQTVRDCPNSGDDVAGTVQAVGSGVTAFRAGDRVAALHQLGAAHGAFAEYAVAWDWTAVRLGAGVGFEAAATVPMAALMAAMGLFAMLRVAEPWAAPRDRRPLLVYGAAGAVGAFAVKLAALVGVHPLICVAGNGIPFVETLVDRSKGDVVLDYREGPEKLVKAIREALQGSRLEYAFDAISEHGSHLHICEVLDTQTGKLTIVLPRHLDDIAPTIEQSTTMAGSLWPTFDRKEGIGKLGMEAGGKEFGAAMSSILSRWLNDGVLAPHPFTVIEGGLQGLETALKTLRAGESSAMKYVIRIDETPKQ